MALKTAARGAQYMLVAEFIGNWNDTVKDINGATKSLGAVFADAPVTFDAILLPVGALAVGGELITDVKGAGPTAYTLQIGTAAVPSAFLGPTTLTAADGQRTPFTLLGPVPGDGSNVRCILAATVANATAGKFRVRVHYTIDGKTNEVVTN